MPSKLGNILRVGIDAGGTFTDIVWIENGILGMVKVPSTPSAPVDAVMSGIGQLPLHPDLVCHGTTVGTNAILSRKGGPAAMVVTSGFRDVIRIGRSDRDNLYSIEPHRSNPLIERSDIYEISLRIDHDGNILTSPTQNEIASVADTILSSGASAVALGILHSAQYPSHEIELASKISELTGLPVFPSSTIAAYPREFERWTAASLAAFLAPVLGPYLAALEYQCPAQLALMVSSGGLVSTSQVLKNPSMCVLSGPAGGAIAAKSIGGKHVLALDMGGTSTDVTLIADTLPRTREASVDGLPVPLPSIDIHTIGAGGGSIVKFDHGGMLALGPESAGADPGPACYGRGGPATNTDAALVSGRIFASRFMGGTMKLDPEESARALERICPPRMKLDDLLDGIIELAQVHLTGALRKISIARGIDPSAGDEPFTLVPFGGAGALFAVECARALGIKNVLHPRAAGVFSALGLASAPIAIERERAVLHVLGDTIDPIQKAQTELSQEIIRELSTWENDSLPKISTVVECRYVGQTHTLDIPLDTNPDTKAIRISFEDAYRTRFTYLHPDTPIEIAAIRVRGELHPPEIEFPDLTDSSRSLDSSVIAITRLRVDRLWLDAPVYDRSILPIDHSIPGPALIAEDFATLYLPPHSSMHLDRKGHARIVTG
jgi:N-methylhydantoinase A/oxoprolinase/acetone carboxylase beta subunit